MKSVLVTSALMSLALLLGRISGFAREVILASKLGATEQADIAVLFLTFPDLAVGLLLAGGFSAALIPALKRRKGQAQATLFQDAFGLGILGFLVLAVLITAFPSALFTVLAPKMGPAEVVVYSPQLRLLLLSLPMVAAVGAITAYLNATGRFFIPGLGTLIFNVVLCVYLFVFFVQGPALWGLIGAIFVALLAKLVSQLSLVREGFRAPLKRQRQIDWNLLRRFFAGVGAFTVIVGAPIVFRSYFAAFEAGNLALFNYAQKLYELPAALLLAPIVTVLLPKLSVLAAKDTNAAQEVLKTGVLASTALSLIAISIGLIFGEALTELIYLHGTMQTQDIAEISTLAKLMFLALPFLGVSQLTTAALNAQLRSNLVFLNASSAMLVALICLWILSDFLSGASVLWVFVGFNVFLSALNLKALVAVGRWPEVLGLWVSGKMVFSVLLISLPFAGLVWATDTHLNAVATLALVALQACLLLLGTRKALAPLFHLRLG